MRMGFGPLGLSSRILAGGQDLFAPPSGIVLFKKSINTLKMHQTHKIFWFYQGTNARKVNCGRVYSAYILKPVLSGRNL